MSSHDPYAAVRDKRLSELTPEQRDLAHELWLRNNYAYFPRHYWDRDDALFPAVMRVIDRLRQHPDHEFKEYTLEFDIPAAETGWRLVWAALKAALWPLTRPVALVPVACRLSVHLKHTDTGFFIAEPRVEFKQ